MKDTIYEIFEPEKISSIKRIVGKVKSVTTDNCYAIVETMDKGCQIKLQNKCGEVLKSGDFVVVEYNKILSSKTGNIIRRNGKPKFNAFIKTLTQTQYDALSDSDKNVDVLYVIVGD